MIPSTIHPPGRLGLEIDMISACGPVREENQDAGAAWRGEQGEVALIVADGMGGHAAGRQAAEIVLRACLESLRRRADDDWQAVLRGAVGNAQAAVLQASGGTGTPGRPAMGATVAVAVLAPGPDTFQLQWAHVGDSRIYLFRGRSLYRLTLDHSLVAALVRDGLLAEEEAFGHPDSNVLQRAIGQTRPLEPEIQGPLELAAGDIVVLCSDGLHGALPDPRIAAVLGQAVDRAAAAEEICARLLAAALAAQSQDNITVACARVTGDRRRRPTRAETGGSP